MFYSFHNLGRFPGQIKCLHILGFDPLEQVGFRPLANLFYYIFYLLFGSNFIFYNILNFIFYFLSLLILYRFALYFIKDKILIAAFIFLYAFLFNHFDILLWSCHIHIIAGFSLFLLGFIAFMEYLKKGGMHLVLASALLFLIGMFCYESFFLWPLGIVILSSIKSLRTQGKHAAKPLKKPIFLILASVYIFYFLAFLFTRSLKTYINPRYSFYDFLQPHVFVLSALSVIFNIYNNLAVAILPIIVFPLKVAENIYMAGPLINYINRGNNWFVYSMGGLFSLIVAALFVYLYKKRYVEEWKIIVYFLFLLTAEPYIIFFCRLLDNALGYCLSEFRYQYIPNAFIILTVAFIIERFVKPSRRRKKLIFAFLALIFFLNIVCIHRVMNIYNYHLSGLQRMISSIKRGIGQGYINSSNRLYIDEDLPDYLPHLCWNIEMGELFIPNGNYKWMFSEKEMENFTDAPQNARWVISKENFGVIDKSQESLSGKGRKINTIRDKYYITPGKDYVYIELGYRYRREGRHDRERRMFEKALELNPRNEEAVFVLEELRMR
ncbi:MAG: hypothetical protein WC441_04655 [Patescibacteria group bacterium]